MEIKIKNLTKIYKNKKVLDNVSLEIHNGVFGLLGENGAGKTTLMEIISTLLPFDDGEIEVAGLNVKKEPLKVCEILGYLPQKFDFFPKVTLEESFDYLCKLKGMNNSASRKQEINLRLQEVGLLSEQKKYIQELSGGMKQRFGIAQALIGNPKIILIDEPTVGLDPHERISFRNLITRISRDKIILLSTHIVQDIASTCKNLMVLQKGKVNYLGSTIDLINKVQGKVWLYNVLDDEIPHVDLFVSLQDKGSSIEIRYIADSPLQGSISTEPTLEDAYIYINRKELSI
ncbi:MULTISPECIES: ATP-binding cassette domain-containing protein [Lysinibacillus]|uniref:ATP-binding cassette domain-containing protein n=1 Tax=Lysinibacillus TaxID=400634 RepID=UPI001C8C975F|nr:MULTISPECIES: ATP-binding cassette domain-containing protein [Lysinibacillus]WHP39462.1 ATP-binding cassette domain-containing protein [Lysinibacillus boronitolerans]MBX8943756.1 ATP-binding cassette domain-containing protein [Lysinibacillus sp. K60]UUV25609.1 ATP-binding cassette domain-containing protein [Lysinibacillus sp. FN11]UYB48483.1 ATP-binding cassette domain-containing protein [Lysinibacillus capsici]WDU80695.1 ATP-binding cassette domain-containing protein [Lysinibacillus sp. G0